MRPLRSVVSRYSLSSISPKWCLNSFAFQSSRACSCSARQNAPTSSPKLNPTTPNPPRPPADHRDLAVSQSLFTTSPYSPGSPLFLPNGAHVFNKLIAFLRAQYTSFGFREVITPTIYKKSLWQTSGHWENYAEDMFEVSGRGASGQAENAQIGEDEEFGLKPMNCPGHCLLFASEKRSYRQLPIRYADFSPLHRNEISGALSGLTRVRRFHQDDGHIFCRPSQIAEEISNTLAFVKVVYGTFGLGPYKLVLSTRPETQFMGTAEEWNRAETQLKDALQSSGRVWTVNEGDGAFYGPKIDIILQDSDGKEHQTATIQLDFQLPQRFGLEYQAPAAELESKGLTTDDATLLEKSGPVTPVIIHRAILGSVERFMALLIEHYNGRWPFWLSPRQAVILTVSDEFHVVHYANRVRKVLSGEVTLRQPPMNGDLKANPLNQPSFVVDTDFSPRSLSKKIAEAKHKRYNFIICVGTRNIRDMTLDVDCSGQPDTDRMKSELDDLRLETYGKDGLYARMSPTTLASLFRDVEHDYR